MPVMGGIILISRASRARICPLRRRLPGIALTVLLLAGQMLVNWGDQARCSEFAADGTLLLDGFLGPKAPSYRAFARQ